MIGIFKILLVKFHLNCQNQLMQQICGINLKQNLFIFLTLQQYTMRHLPFLSTSYSLQEAGIALDCQSKGLKRLAFDKQCLTPQIYEQMTNRGWYRVGTLFAKNLCGQSCCKEWETRISVHQFKPSKKQLKIARKLLNLFHDQEQVSTILRWSKSSYKNQSRENYTQEKSKQKLECLQSASRAVLDPQSLQKKQLDRIFYDLYLQLAEDPRQILAKVSDLFPEGFELRIQIVPADFRKEDYEIYKQYFKVVHESSTTKKKYTQFLCQQNLKFSQEQSLLTSIPEFHQTTWTQSSQGNAYTFRVTESSRVTKRLGCYHMRYFLRDTIIAVNVVDLLPQKLVSKYFFYWPSLKAINLPNFSVLIDIEYACWVKKSFPELCYYSMGFYCQRNNKMSYKNQYQPLQLLCPITYQFVKFNQEVRSLIDDIQNNNLLPKLSKAQIPADMILDEDNASAVEKFKEIEDIIAGFEDQKSAQMVRKEIEKVCSNLKYYVENLSKQICQKLRFQFCHSLKANGNQMGDKIQEILDAIIGIKRQSKQNDHQCC